MKGFTVLRVFGVLFALTILYRRETDAETLAVPLADPIAKALANPLPDADARRALLAKVVGRVSKKAFSRLTGATTTALGQAAGAHVADKIFHTNEQR